LQWINNGKRCGVVTVGFHWITVLLIIAAYGCIELRFYYPKEREMRSVLKAWHFSLGLSIFLLAWVRLMLR